MRRVVVLLLGLGLALSLAPASPATADSDLTAPKRKDVAMQLVSSAENSSLAWRRQFRYIEDIGDGRGYTAGIIGFCSRTGDMLALVRRYTRMREQNPLRRFLPALRDVYGSASHRGLGAPFVRAWRQAARDRVFQRAQAFERDRVYFNPSVRLAKRDGLHALGQFAYYDAAVVHGFSGMRSIRARALERSDTPTGGETEAYWLQVFLEERLAEMRKEPAHAEQLDRITKTQMRFLREENFTLRLPLRWTVNQTRFRILR